MEMYPLKFQPIYKEKIWGGRRLAETFGKNLPPKKKIGESWELADLPDDKTTIVNGPMAGQTIEQVVGRFGKNITGKKIEGPLPLLIKFLDAQDILSVQVHPDKAACRRMNAGQPKTECWYIIDAAPQAVIYKGLRPGTTKEKLAGAVKNGSCEELLEKIPVATEDCHLLPAGTCHAIGAGLLIAEVQQPGVTYRLFDWNRPDKATVKGRPLHINEALESINFNCTTEKTSAAATGRLVDCPAFRIDRFDLPDGKRMTLEPGIMKVMVFIAGNGKIRSRRCQDTDFAAGDTVLIPAAFEGFIEPETNCRFLAVTI